MYFHWLVPLPPRERGSFSGVTTRKCLSSVSYAPTKTIRHCRVQVGSERGPDRLDYPQSLSALNTDRVDPIADRTNTALTSRSKEIHNSHGIANYVCGQVCIFQRLGAITNSTTFPTTQPLRRRLLLTAINRVPSYQVVDTFAAVVLGGGHVAHVVAAEVVASRQLERCRERLGHVDGPRRCDGFVLAVWLI